MPVQRHRVIAQFVAQALRNRLLALFDGLIDELFDAAAVKTHDMVVMRPLIKFEDRHAVFEMMARHQPGRLELREHAIDGREANVLVGLDQSLVDALGGHVTGRTALENFEDLESRPRDLESGLAQILAFQAGGLLKTMRYDAPP